MTDAPYVGITTYPVSTAFASSAKEALGHDLDLLDVAALRRLKPSRLVTTLRSYRGRHFALLLEDEASRALVPILLLLPILAGAATVTIVGPNGAARSVPKRAVFPAMLALVRATVSVRLAARKAAREADLLARTPHVFRTLPDTQDVLYVNANLWFGLKAGGSVGHVAGVVNELVAAGFRVDLAAISRQPLLRSEVKIIPLRHLRTLGLPAELNQYKFSQSSTAQLADLASRKSYRFIYQRLSLGNYTGAALAQELGVPLVLEYNGSEVWAARHWGGRLRSEELAGAAEDVSMRHADVVVTVSQVLGDELVARGIEPHRIVVYPNGVDPERFDPERLRAEAEKVRARLGIARSAIVVAFVGTFGLWHGAEVLAQAIRLLANHDAALLEEYDVQFLFVGDGLRMPFVREVLRDASAARTHFVGLVRQEDAPGYLAASDVLVSPHVPNADGSRFFGSPTKLFEYMAMGRAIVASDLDQIGDVLQPGLRVEPDSGTAIGGDDAVAVLTKPGDACSLVAALRYVVTDPMRRRTLGSAARRRALERHTWRHHVAAILERLDDVAGG